MGSVGIGYLVAGAIFDTEKMPRRQPVLGLEKAQRFFSAENNCFSVRGDTNGLENLR